jgi:DNA polymerase III epsilon subunit-like protein
MELEIIENNFIAEKIEAFLTAEKFEEFKNQLQTLATVTFEKNELGRKEARSLSRKIGTLKAKITERFDDLIKSEKAKNDEFVKYLKELTSTKAKYLAECVDIQNVLKKDVDAFDFKIERQLEAMKSVIKQYQSLEDLKNARQSLVYFYTIEWEEKRKDAEKLFIELHDKLVMQEGMIAQLEKERAERQELEAQREKERLEREREAQERLIREQAERLVQGKDIELPPIPTPVPAPTPIATPQQQSYAIQAPAKIENNFTIVFDTETTGVNNQKDTIVQLAALVFDEDFNEIDLLNVLIKQDREMTDEEILTRVHGKTYKMCQEQGIPLAEAITRFKAMLDGCGVVIAHNMSFDEGFLKSAATKVGMNFEINIRKMDTMALYKDIVKCPPTAKMIKAGFTRYKNPNLTESYNYVFGKDFENAHDALGDAKVTAELYKNLVMVNRKVVSILESSGLSKDQSRLIANRLRMEDLTAYTQADIVSVVNKTKEQQAEIERLKAEILELKK